VDLDEHTFDAGRGSPLRGRCLAGDSRISRQTDPTNRATMPSVGPWRGGVG
jgi:hypothetical protein